MKTPVRSVVHVHKTLLVSALVGLGIALSYTYWFSQPLQKGKASISQRYDYPSEWLGV